MTVENDERMSKEKNPIPILDVARPTVRGTDMDSATEQAISAKSRPRTDLRV